MLTRMNIHVGYSLFETTLAILRIVFLGIGETKSVTVIWKGYPKI